MGIEWNELAEKYAKEAAQGSQLPHHQVLLLLHTPLLQSIVMIKATQKMKLKQE